MTTKSLVTSVALVGTLAFAAVPAYAQHRGGGGARTASSAHGHSYSAPVYHGGGAVHVAPHVVVGSRGYYGGGSYYRSSFYRPYYAFRPHVSLGFGLWLGYPVAYPYYSANPYAAAYPYAYPADPYAYGAAAPAYGAPAPNYGYPAQPSYDPYQSSAQGYPQQPAPSVGVQRGNQRPTSGGVSFDITPANAAVFVDGRQIGEAGQFGPSSAPLDLNPGHHRVEIRASGYRTMSFDAEVIAGQVIPVQGTLEHN